MVWLNVTAGACILSNGATGGVTTHTPTALMVQTLSDVSLSTSAGRDELPAAA